MVGCVNVWSAVGEDVCKGGMVRVGVGCVGREQVGHELAPVHLSKLVPRLSGSGLATTSKLAEVKAFHVIFPFLSTSPSSSMSSL